MRRGEADDVVALDADFDVDDVLRCVASGSVGDTPGDRATESIGATGPHLVGQGRLGDERVGGGRSGPARKGFGAAVGRDPVGDDERDLPDVCHAPLG